MKKKKKSKNYTPLSDKILILGIYLLILSGGISYLKVGISGISITRDGGKPFLYEVSFLLLIFAFLFNIFKNNKILINKEKNKIFALITLIHMPIFIVHLLLSKDIMYAYFGLGQLRLLLILNITAIIGLYYPINNRILKHTIISIVIVGLSNSIYAILAHFNIVELLYASSPRIPGFARHSGLMSVPASLGVLSALNIAIGYWLFRRKNIKIGILVLLISSAGVFLSISFSAILAVFIMIFILYLKSIKKYSISSILFFIPIIVFLLIVAQNYDLIISQNIKRIESISGSIKLWLDSYMIGIPWGEMDRYLGGDTMIFPHNWLLVSLIHGGLLSFIALLTLYTHFLRKVIKVIILNKEESSYQSIILISIIMLLVAALFEQIFLLVPSVFVLYLFIGFSTQKINGTEREK